MLTPEEKLLRLVLKRQIEDRQSAVAQLPPVCPKCKKAVDICDDSVSVDFRDVDVNGKTITLAEPFCPACNTKIEGKIATFH